MCNFLYFSSTFGNKLTNHNMASYDLQKLINSQFNVIYRETTDANLCEWGPRKHRG